MKPLVSILIPAYNAEQWIAYTLQSALAQTWKHREIIVVDDGSKDRTAEIARTFASKELKVVTIPNQGAPAARNRAFEFCQGDYIQWLDADDLLVPDKIERQLRMAEQLANKRLLLSSPWASFFYRTDRAQFIQNSLCQDLSPADWLVAKMSENLHMQTATWLTSRELTQAAGPWDGRLLSDDDGEYFCRVLLASEGVRFVGGTGVYYRVTTSSRLSRIGHSDKKKDAMLFSMKQHMRYLRSLEDSRRVRDACLIYMQNWMGTFYPERVGSVAELQRLAAELGGSLQPYSLRRKYAWIQPVFGWGAAKWAEDALPMFKASCLRRLDQAVFHLRGKREANAAPPTQSKQVL